MNALVETYRKYLADTGQKDDATDYDITQRLGEWAQQSNPKLFEAFPDFAEQYGEIRDANAPSLAGEFGRALKSGTQGLASVGLGGLGLLTDSDYLKEKAASFERDAAENAPTIPTLEDIAPGRRGIGSVFSKDAVRYGLSKLGSVAPSIVEGVGAAAAGGAIGTLAAPGPGTIAGAAEGLVARGLIKSAIRSLVKKGVAEELLAKGVITEASEAALEQAIKAGVKGLADKVSVEAMAIGAKRGLAATNLANSFLLNAGDVASEGADRPTTMALGLIAAIPDSIIPGYVVGRMFPGVKASAALPLAKQFIGDRAMKALTAAGIVGVEAGTEYFQEAVNVVARNLKEGKDAMEFTPADLRRFREAGIAGAFGGGLAAPSVFLSPTETTTADVPPVPPPPAIPPPPRPFAPIIDPLAGLGGMPDTAGVVTPFDEARAGLQDDEAGRLLAEQQAAIDQRLNPPPAPGPSALETGLAMAGETPEIARERELRRRAFGMTGAPVPDASDPEQVARREAEQAGLAMAGNVPPELAEPNPVVPPTNILPVPASGEPVAALSDYEQYQLVQAKMVQMARDGLSSTPEFKAVFQENENIKNRHGGMPPTKPEAVTLAQLPPDIAANVTDTPPPAPAAPVVEPLVAATAPIDVAKLKGKKIGDYPGPMIEFVMPDGSRRHVSIRRGQGMKDARAKLANELEAERPKTPEQEGYKLLHTLDDAETAQRSMKPGKNYRVVNRPDGKVELWFKPKGRGFSVGMSATGIDDILNYIEGQGGISSRSSAKNPGGEYDGLAEAFRGRAKLLISKGGLAPDELAQMAYEDGLIGSPDSSSLYTAVERALANREKAGRSIGAQEAEMRFDLAFLSNEHPRKWLRAGKPVSIDDLNIGDSFEVNGEKFTVKDIDENGNVTVKDGVTRIVPPGTPVFPDKGEVKTGKRPEVGSDWDAEMAKGEEAPQEHPFAGPLGDQLVKIPAKRAKTGENIEVEMTARKAEKMLSSHLEVMQKLLTCLGT